MCSADYIPSHMRYRIFPTVNGGVLALADTSGTAAGRYWSVVMWRSGRSTGWW
jgi:hypothetical protein